MGEWSEYFEDFPEELLKRKMPPSIFPSKYLRLISFGKVENDH